MRYTVEPDGQLRIDDENESLVNNQNIKDETDYIRLFGVLGIIVVVLGILTIFLPWTAWQWIIGGIVSLISIAVTCFVIDKDDEDVYCGNFIFKGAVSIVSIIMLCKFGANFTIILQCIMIIMSIEIILMYLVMLAKKDDDSNPLALISAPIIFILNIVLLICRFKLF